MLIDLVCSSEGSASPWRETTSWQHVLKRCQNGIYILTAGIVTHQTDTQQTSLKRAEHAAELDNVLVQQSIAYRQLIHTLGQTDGGQDRKSIAWLGEDVQPQRFNAGFE